MLLYLPLHFLSLLISLTAWAATKMGCNSSYRLLGNMKPASTNLCISSMVEHFPVKQNLHVELRVTRTGLYQNAKRSIPTSDSSLPCLPGLTF